MKRIIGSLAALILLCALSLPLAAAAALTPELDHGGGSGDFLMRIDTAPFIDNGRTFLPIRFVAEAFGIYTTWDNVTKTAKLTRGSTTVYLTIGSKTMPLIKNGKESKVEMDVAPMLRNNRTCLPVRFVAEAFEFDVEWQGDFTETHPDGTVYRGKVVITEDLKTLNLIIGKNELMLRGGHFLTFYENEDFRFAYPLYPECTDLSEGNTISFLSPPWLGFNRIIKVTYEPVTGTPFENKKLESVISYIGSQYKTTINKAYMMINGTPAVAYGLEPVDDYPFYGVAFFHNDMLMRFEVSIVAINVPGLDGIGHARFLLEELLPSLVMYEVTTDDNPEFVDVINGIPLFIGYRSDFNDEKYNNSDVVYVSNPKTTGGNVVLSYDGDLFDLKIFVIKFEFDENNVSFHYGDIIYEKEHLAQGSIIDYENVDIGTLYAEGFSFRDSSGTCHAYGMWHGGKGPGLNVGKIDISE